MIKKYRPFIILFFICSAASLIAASFVDLNLDKLLNNPNNPFALWFEATGEMPCRLICVFGGAVIFFLAENKPLKILGLIVEIGGSAYFGYYISYYLFLDRYKIPFGILFGLGVGFFVLYLGRYIAVPEQFKRALVILSIAGIIVMFVQLGIVEIIKMLWGRVRFRDLLKEGSFDAFTAWYIPNGVNGNKSFPSGHTGGAAMSYLIMFFPFINREKWLNKSWLCFLVPFVFTSTVAFTRLVVGAHYLSDVTMGGTIGFITVIAGIAVLDKKFFKTELQ